MWRNLGAGRAVMVGSLSRLSGRDSGVAVSAERERDGGGVAAGSGDEGDVQRDRALAGGEQGVEDGDAERSAGLAGGVEDSGGQADAVSRRMSHRDGGHGRHGERGEAEGYARRDQGAQRTAGGVEGEDQRTGGAGGKPGENDPPFAGAG